MVTQVAAQVLLIQAHALSKWSIDWSIKYAISYYWLCPYRLSIALWYEGGGAHGVLGIMYLISFPLSSLFFSLEF
jgi:hypothetical protein